VKLQGSGVVAMVRKVADVVRGELVNLRPMEQGVTLVTRALPNHVGNRVRASALRARGIDVGEGTMVYGTPDFVAGGDGFAKMTIGKNCVIDVGCHFELGEAITIGDRVTLGNEVMVITTSHELGPREHRAGPLMRAAVRIEDGAWLGPRSVVLPGVTIGAGAIVDPGSVVNKTIPPNTRVRGTPARVVEELAP